MGSLFYHGRALGTVYPDISIRLHNFIKYTSAVTVSPVLLTKLSVTENQMCFFFYLSLFICLFALCCGYIPLCAPNAVNSFQDACDVKIKLLLKKDWRIQFCSRKYINLVRMKEDIGFSS